MKMDKPASPYCSWAWLFGHRWGRWEVIQVPVMMTGLLVPDALRGKQLEKTYQQRECLACGKKQQEPL